MKKSTYKLFAVLLCFFFVSANIFAQEDDASNAFETVSNIDTKSNISAPFLYSQIGDKGFVGMRVQPELAFGKLGFGLDVPIMFSVDDWKFRTDEFESGIGWLRMIRYVRWGVKKRDPFYARVGELSGSYLGYGMLINNYDNSVSFDKRKLGAEFDILINDMYGIEGLYSDFDFSSMNLLGIRPYVRPLGKTGIPIIKTIDVGISYVTDHDYTKIVTDSFTYQNQFIKSGMNAYAGDIGIQILNTSFIHLTAYTQYGYIMKNTSDSLKTFTDSQPTGTLINKYDAGSGIGAGLDLKVKFLDKVLRTDAKLERVWYNDYFLPQFFDLAYEMGKDAKLMSLTQTKKQQGTIGSLSFTLLDKIRVGGSLWIPDGMDEQSPGLFRLDLDGSQISEKIVLKATYAKVGLIDLNDAIKIDDRSLAKLRIGYKLYKFLEVGLDYKWTFIVNSDQKWEASNIITPYFGLVIPLNF